MGMEAGVPPHLRWSGGGQLEGKHILETQSVSHYMKKSVYGSRLLLKMYTERITCCKHKDGGWGTHDRQKSLERYHDTDQMTPLPHGSL